MARTPTAVAPPPPPQAGGPPGWLHVAHLGLTGALLVGVLGLAVLAGTGRLHFGRAEPAAAEVGSEKGGGKKGGAGGGTTKEDEKGGDPLANQKEGRYRIEPLDDVRRLLEVAGPIGFFGQSVQSAWVWRYAGGYLECRLETDLDGKTYSAGTMPVDWKAILPRDERLSLDNPKAFRKEGYVILTAMQPILPVNEALSPYYVHLGGLFGAGPAGPLAPAMTTHLEARGHRPFRVFLTGGPPKDVPGPAFNLWDELSLLVRARLIDDPARGGVQRTFQGKDLAPGQDFSLLEWQRGLSMVRLKARFLTDEEVVKYSSGR